MDRERDNPSAIAGAKKDGSHGFPYGTLSAGRPPAVSAEISETVQMIQISRYLSARIIYVSWRSPKIAIRINDPHSSAQTRTVVYVSFIMRLSRIYYHCSSTDNLIELISSPWNQTITNTVGIIFFEQRIQNLYA